MAEPFIVICAPNGARKTQSDHPAVPYTPKELAECAERVLDAGAAIMHLHVRDENGGHSLSADRYQRAIDAIRHRIGDNLLIQVTTEACGIYSPEEQMAVVRELRPEAVSLALRELCADSASEPSAKDFFSELQSNGILSQYILYSPEEVFRFVNLVRRGVIPKHRASVLFVLGRYSDDLTGVPEDLDAYIAVLDDAAEWTVCCFGKAEHAAVKRAASLGGHARVGFENNLFLPDGSIAKDNADLVRLAAGSCGDRPLASAADLRKRFA